MKKHRLFRFLYFFWGILAVSSLKCAAQDLTGIWRGYFITEYNDQYRFEIQIEQNKKKGISGVSYSYLTTVFYGKATLTGTYTPSTKTIMIQEIKTVELRMSAGSVACIMKFLMEYTKSGNEEFLEGPYTSKYEKTDTRSGIKKGEACGIGKAYLRKVSTSDFYVEPFLRDKPSFNKPVDDTLKKAPVTKTPAPKAPVKKAPVTKTTPTVKKPAVKPKTGTTQKPKTPPVVKKEVEKISPQPKLTIPTVTRSRKNELAQTINVSNNEVQVKLYDNGEIDDDTISVYLDNRLILSKRRLSAEPINLNLKLDESASEHVLVMVAENMGRIPPNTSLMIVHDGDKKYEVRITSTGQKNAMVRFRYQSGD